MELKDFSSVRVGSGHPASFDVKPISDCECYGVYAHVYAVRNRRVELRKNEYGEIALFNFKYPDLKLPGEWEDSEILWENKVEEVK